MFLFLLPVLFILLMGYLLNLGGYKQDFVILPVVNLDEGKVGDYVISRLVLMKGIRVKKNKPDGTTFKRDEVLSGVAEGKYRIALILHRNFSREIIERGESRLHLAIQPGLDGFTEGLLKSGIEGTVENGVLEYLQKGREEESFDFPMKRIEVVSFIPDQAERTPIPGFAMQFLAGMGILWASFISFSILSFYDREKSLGTLLRYRVAPIKKSYFMTGKFIAYYIIVILQQLVLLGLSLLFVDIKPVSFILLCLICLLVSACAVAWGLFVTFMPGASSSKRRWNLAVLLISSVMGGCIIPYSMMAPVFHSISKIFPQRWALTAYSYALLQPAHRPGEFFLCLAILLIFTLSFLWVAFKRFSMREEWKE